MTQQDDITQRVLTDDEIQALWDEACKDRPQAPGWNRHIRFARALLSKLRAPVPDSTLPLEQALHELVDKIVPGLDTGDLVQDARRASTALSAALASAPVAGEARPSDVDILSLAGQYIQTRAQDAGPQIMNFARALLSRYAAPQASEAVRNAALEEAAASIDEIDDGAAPEYRACQEHIRALKQPQADKDGAEQALKDLVTHGVSVERIAPADIMAGGQQRAGDVDERAVLDGVRAALPEFRQQDYYLLAHGASLMSEDSHEIIHIDTLRRVIRAALSAPQAEQGERDAK